MPTHANVLVREGRGASMNDGGGPGIGKVELSSNKHEQVQIGRIEHI